MMVLIVPGVSRFISQIIQPVDSLQEVEMKKLLVGNSVADKYQRGYDQWRKANPHTIWQVHRKAYALERMGAYERINNDFMGELNNQTELAQMISRISPTSSFVYLASSLAGTGVGESERFRNAVTKYAKGFVSLAWGGWVSCGDGHRKGMNQ